MIPTMLKDQKKWVCWKKEKVKGRITKIPYNPKNGKKAKSTDAQTWSSYEGAVEAKGYDGMDGRRSGRIRQTQSGIAAFRELTQLDPGNRSPHHSPRHIRTQA